MDDRTVEPGASVAAEADPDAPFARDDAARSDATGAPGADRGDGGPVRRLPDAVVNRIAAGEVVERPASVVKELVENALDAGARRIAVATAAGGKTLVRVADDGRGMDRDDLALAVERHCTSKLAHESFSAIRTLGFRGEALPSIAAVSRLSIRTRAAGADTGLAIAVEGGRVGEIAPVAHPAGTVVEVRDLFFATPARLKFLKADRTEAGAIADVVRRLALAHPDVAFRLSEGERAGVSYPAAPIAERIAAVMGRAFADASLPLEAAREGVAITGRIATPSHTRAQASHQFVFVNGRPVRDRTLQGAIKAGFQDVLPRDRHPVCVLYLAVDPALVDVNVHPAKTEVRFRDAALVRGLLVSAIRARLAGAAVAAGPGETAARLAAFRAAGAGAAPSGAGGRGWGGRAPTASVAAGTAAYDPRGRSGNPADAGAAPTGFAEETQDAFSGLGGPAARAFASTDAGGPAETFARGESVDGPAPAEGDGPAAGADDHPLGAALAQIHGNYILAQTATGVVLVDQHAAHERIVYERLKAARAREGVAAQALLVPEIVEMGADEVEALAAHADELARFGLVLEPFGPGAVAVREVPAMLARLDVAALVRDLASELPGLAHADRLEALIDHVAATVACHGSVRAGRRLSVPEMNALLRQIEETPNAGRCNHGRPTVVELDLADLERLFRRR